jgi:hypothetical protein
MKPMRIMRRGAAAVAFAALVIAGPALPVALANDPLGACCMANGSCENLQAVQCVGPGESFIGEGTSCATINCAAPVAVPVLSIFGMVAAAGALAALGIGRLFTRRHG